MLFLVIRCYQNVVIIGKTKIKISCDFLDRSLKSLSGVAEPERHKGKFKKTKRSDNSCFRDIFIFDWNLVIRFD
jgi:hypothetical protein